MFWLLLLHIAALLCWCGSLLYLPAVITTTAAREHTFAEPAVDIPRTLFTHLVTPAALLAIISGTALFITEHIVAAWLVLKLTLVTGLVVIHAFTGWLILVVEKTPRKRISLFCLLLDVVAILLISVIIWLVLAKPF